MRKATILRVRLGVALTLLLASTPVAAQVPPPAKPPPPSLAELQEAAREADTGARLNTQGIFERALVHYRRAYELAHKPSDLMKVAECQRALGDLGAAHDTYLTLLATHGPALGYQSIAVKKAITEIEAATGTVAVRSVPEGASVRAGGRFIGVTPLPAAARLAAGDTRVEVLKDGFEPFATTVRVDPTRPASVEATLVVHATTGHLTVREAHGMGAHLLLDGQDVGPLPWVGEVAPGTHQLELQGALLKAAPLTAKLRAGGQAEAVFIATSTAGHLRITTRPPEASIEVDGKVVGTGNFEGDVVTGDHKVRVSAPGFKASEQVVSLLAQASAVTNVELERFVSPEETARLNAEKEAEAYRGGYGQVALVGAIGASTTHICGDLQLGSASTACTTGVAYGGGLSVRGGYSFGTFGIEGIAILMADYSKDTVNYTASSSTPVVNSIADVTHGESYSWLRTAGMIAVGPRFITPGHDVRFTIGAGGGLVVREVFLARTLSGNAIEAPPYADSALVLSPGLTADIGLTIGSTPGTSFSFGAMLWTDFPSATQVSSKSISQTTTTPGGTAANFTGTAGPFTVESGAQVYIGPYLGVRWGH